MVQSDEFTPHPQDPTGAPEALHTGRKVPNLVAHSLLAWHARQTKFEQKGAVNDVQLESAKQFTQMPVLTSQKPAALPNLVQSLSSRQPTHAVVPEHTGAAGEVQLKDEIQPHTPEAMLQTGCALPYLPKHSKSDPQPRHVELEVSQIGFALVLLPTPQLASVVHV